MRVLLSGGGTGGHVYPAIAIADKIKENHPEAEILFVGTSNGIESKLVPDFGYDIKTVTVQGFKRKLDFDNFKRVLVLLNGLNDSRKIVNSFNPDIVIGTGGYVSGPVLFMSSKGSITTIIHEQNAFPGVTNKILSTTVSKVVTSFEDSHDRFPKFAKSKLVLTGNPIRKEILNSDRGTARKILGIDKEKKMVLCYGGSGGSKKINDNMIDAVKKMVDEDVAFIFATGKKFYDSYIANFSGIEFKPYQQIIPYLDGMANALSASDIVITSAGAISLAEITTLGKASIIIPKSHTAENHQEYNARNIEKSGAGICILEKDINPQALSNALFDIIYDDLKLLDMSKNSELLGQRDAIDRIYDEILNAYNSNEKHITKKKINDSSETDIISQIKPIKIKKKTLL